MSMFRSSLLTVLNWWPWMNDWRNPEYVWKFQKFFGVQNVKTEVGSNPNSPYIPKDYDEYLREERFLKDSKNDPSAKEDLQTSGYSSAADAVEQNVIYYKINSLFWYYVFLIGTQLGDETYYSIFFCLWFWNIDSVVGRKVVFVWNLVMYIGQGMKDIIRWPRPAMPPAIQLEAKWSLEYGMPSTHAMVGLAVPSSIVFCAMERYETPVFWWAAVAFVWCCLVCLSRLYLGVHSIADVFVGLVFGAVLLIFIFPLTNQADEFLYKHPYSPIVTTILSVGAAVYYPGSDRWTPARGDTTIINGCYMGLQWGVWTYYHLGYLRAPDTLPPYPIMWPTQGEYGLMIVRMAVGAVIFLATKAVVKPLTIYAACYIMNEDPNKLMKQKNDIKNKHKMYADLTQKFIVHLAVGFNIITISPLAFQVMGVERATYYTEL